MLIALGLNLLLIGIVATGLSLASRILGPKSRIQGEKGLPYETGMPPFEPSPVTMPVLYYRFAVLFVIFDVDLAFLVPWVWLRHSLSLTVMVSMTVFFLLVGFMLTYVWRKGILTCR